MRQPLPRRPPKSVFSAGLSALVAMAVAACTPSRASESPVARDSAGIQLVESTQPGWEPGQAWTIAAEPTVDFGGDSTQSLASVGAIVPLAWDGLAIQNNGTSQLLILDSAGLSVRSIGRQGQGPGEFAGIWGTFRCGGDSILVDQGRQVSIFDAHGQFVAREPIQRAPAMLITGVEGVAGDCSALLLLGQSQSSSGPKQSAEQYTLFWTTRRRAASDTAISFSGPELGTIAIAERQVAAPLPFGRRPVWAVSRDALYWGSSDHPEIRQYVRGTGLVRVVRWNTRAQPLADQDRAEYSRRRTDYLRLYPEEAVAYRDLGEYRTPSTKPIYAGIMVDEAGRIWVRPYPTSAGGFPTIALPEPNTEPESWWVFDEQGRWLGTVAMPSGLSVMAITNSHVYGVAIDSLGAERVRGYRIQR